MDKFFQGMNYLLRGMKCLFLPGVKRFVVLPILFNFMLFSTLFYFIYHYVSIYSQMYMANLPWWLSFLHDIFLIVFVISFFLLFLSMFTVIFNLIAAPFNGLLAEKAQAILYRSTIPSLPFSTIVWRSIKRQGQFLWYFFPRFVAMCLLFFVPFIHPVYPFLWFFFNAWMLSVQYQDFAMDNNLVGFHDMRKKIENNKLNAFGFGTVVNLASFIPILNIFTMPAAVIGGVILYRESNQKTITEPLS